MIYIILFLEFFKIGLFSVGGGLATLPFLKELIDKYGWISQEELLNMIAISESTPGPIGINTATYVGYQVSGVLGGIIAIAGIVAPALIIIIVIAHYFDKFYERPLVKGAFYGVRPAVTGLIASVAFGLGRAQLFNPGFTGLAFFNIKAILLFLLLFFLIYRYKKHPIVYIVTAAIIGVIFKF